MNNYKNEPPKETSQVYIGNLPNSLMEDDLAETFNLKQLKVSELFKTGVKTFCFVDCGTPEKAVEFCNKMHGFEVRGRKLCVRLQREISRRPRGFDNKINSTPYKGNSQGNVMHSHDGLKNHSEEMSHRTEDRVNSLEQEPTSPRTHAFADDSIPPPLRFASHHGSHPSENLDVPPPLRPISFIPENLDVPPPLRPISFIPEILPNETLHVAMGGVAIPNRTCIYENKTLSCHSLHTPKNCNLPETLEFHHEAQKKGYSEHPNISDENKTCHSGSYKSPSPTSHTSPRILEIYQQDTVKQSDKYVKHPDDRHGQPLENRYFQEPENRFVQEQGYRHVQEQGNRQVQKPSNKYDQESRNKYDQESRNKYVQEQVSRYVQELEKRYEYEQGNRYAQVLESTFIQQPQNRHRTELVNRGHRYMQELGNGYEKVPGRRYEEVCGSRYEKEPGDRYAQKPGNGFTQQPHISNEKSLQHESGYTSYSSANNVKFRNRRYRRGYQNSVRARRVVHLQGPEVTLDVSDVPPRDNKPHCQRFPHRRVAFNPSNSSSRQPSVKENDVSCRSQARQLPRYTNTSAFYASRQKRDQVVEDTEPLYAISVANFPYRTTEDMIFELFENFEPVDIVMVCNYPDSYGMTEAFVIFSTEEQALDAITNLDNTLFNNRPLYVTEVDDECVLEELQNLQC